MDHVRHIIRQFTPVPVESTKVTFGHSLLQYFALDPNLINLNFGSFGSVPVEVQQYQSKCRELLHRSPDKWFRFQILNRLSAVRHRISQYIGINDPTDLVFIPNVSYGCNIILRSLALHIQKIHKNDPTQKYKLLHFNTAHKSIKNILHLIAHFFGDAIEIIKFYVTTETINNRGLLLASLEQFITDNDSSSIYCAMISHITSAPAVRYDVKAITHLLHKYHILSAIDGAHCLGQIKLDLNDMNCDFYVSNGHKWLMSPHASAVMYVKKHHQSLIHPLVISSGPWDGQDTSNSSLFQNNFNFAGSSDQTTYLAMGAALDFREKMSHQKNDDLWIEYCHHLAINGGKTVADKWETSRLIENDDYVANMVNIKLPTQNDKHIKFIKQRLFSQSTENQKYTYLGVFKWKGVWYCRLSAQIYNELTDFEWLAEAVLSVLDSICNQ
eukprot:702317_1